MSTAVLQRKLRVLADAAKYDASCASSGSKGRGATDGGGGLGSTEGMGICHSYTPDGRCVSLLKLLLTNVCIYDCAYCVNRRSSDVERATFEPEEVVRLTIEFYRRNYIEGLFLSSGVLRSPDDTMERMVEVARRLRERERFNGYIHLKAVAGASPRVVALAGRYADRVSVNIELPTNHDLARFAPEKRTEQIEAAMQTLRHGIEEHKPARASKEASADAEVAPSRSRGKQQLFAPAGQSTQMIIGATPSTDRSVLTTADALYQRHALRRVYYSAYSPIPFADPALPAEAAPLLREHRLYQADWLLRFYGFDVDEVTPTDRPDLDLSLDPKLAWALAHREQFPVDLGTAPRELLLRVPGLGVRSVDRIVQSRRHTRITLDALARMRVSLRKIAPFITTGEKQVTPARSLDRLDLRDLVAPPQLDLFERQK